MKKDNILPDVHEAELPPNACEFITSKGLEILIMPEGMAKKSSAEFIAYINELYPPCEP